MSSTYLRVKINKEGLKIGTRLIRKLFGISQTTERQSLVSMITSCAQDTSKWGSMSPCLATALVCLTHDIEIKIPGEFQWPEKLRMADLVWQPYLLNYNTLPMVTPRHIKIASGMEAIFGLNDIEVIGPHRESGNMLLSLDHAPDDSLSTLLTHWSLDCNITAPAQIIKPFVKRKQLHE